MPNFSYLAGLVVFQGCFKCVSNMFQDYFKDGLRKFKRILKQVSRGFPEDFREIPRCFKCNSIAFQGSLMKISKVFQKI